MTGELSQGVESKLIKKGVNTKKGRNKKKRRLNGWRCIITSAAFWGWVRCLVCWSQAGHLHWCVAHKSCLMAERTDTASILAPTNPLPPFHVGHFYDSRHEQQRSSLKVGAPVRRSWGGELQLLQTVSQSETLVEPVLLLTHLSGEEGNSFPQLFVYFKDFGINNCALALLKFNDLSGIRMLLRRRV